MRLVRSVGPAVALVAVLCSSGPLAAQTPLVSLQQRYDDLRRSAPDGRRVAVAGFELRRGEFELVFESGTFHLLADAAGINPGAVFLGRGHYTLTPADPRERNHLRLVTANDDLESLRDDFTAMVLLAADGFDFDVLEAGELLEGSPDPAAIKAFEAAWRKQRQDLRANLQLRLLTSVSNQSGIADAPFYAYVDGASYPPALIVSDPLGIDASGLTSHWSRERSFLLVEEERAAQFWYAGRSWQNDPRPYPEWADVEHYDLELAIAPSLDVAGTATLTLSIVAPEVSVLPLSLMPRLRVQSVELQRQGADAWSAGGFVQEDEEEDGDFAALLPEPVAAGDRVRLRIRYSGEDVLLAAGDDNYYVNARTSWYPNLQAFRDPATFHITYRVPEDLEVVSVGRQVEERTADGLHIQVWESELPIRVAGFNYGKFKRQERQDEVTGLLVEVYSNPGRPEFLDLMHRYLGGSAQGLGDGPRAAIINPRANADQNAAQFQRGFVGDIDPGALAESALIDGINAARIGSDYFGALGLGHIAITQQSQWSFGQSWPSLIYMPYLAFLSSIHRVQLGDIGLSYLADAQIERLGYHELAHQWWGHQVGWSGYRHQWLSEGIAEFTAGLVTEAVEGPEAADRFWEEARERIMGKPRGAKLANWEAGPVSMGYRLRTRRTPGAAGAMIYSKGAYIIHMLRMMMWQPGAEQPEKAFIDMMHDFASSYAGRSPTSADFQEVVERHMLPQMNAAGDGTMQWFFDQWLHGSELPSIRYDLDVDKAGDAFRLHGTVRQEDVSDRFLTVAPLYLDFGKDRIARIGALLLRGTEPLPVDLEIALPEKPRKVLLNARYDVLTRD